MGCKIFLNKMLFDEGCVIWFLKQFSNSSKFEMNCTGNIWILSLGNILLTVTEKYLEGSEMHFAFGICLQLSKGEEGCFCLLYLAQKKLVPNVLKFYKISISRYSIQVSYYGRSTYWIMQMWLQSSIHQDLELM